MTATERPSDLLPCPFCGGTARPTAHLECSWFAPACKACGVRGPTVRIERGSDPQKLRELMSEADRLWNTRTLDAAPADPVVSPGRSPQSIMMSAHALCPSEITAHPARMRWMADYFMRELAKEQSRGR
jgi:hypothetical protein